MQTTNEMKLSEIGIPVEQMKKLGDTYGVTWMGRGFDRAAGDGELSSTLIRAIETHGIGDMDTTFKAALQMQGAESAAQSTAYIARRGKLSWYGETVYVDGIADHGLDGLSVALRMEKMGLVTWGNIGHGAARVVSEEVLRSLRVEHANSVAQIERMVNAAPARVQLWEPCERCGAEPSYHTTAGHLCNACAVNA